METKKSKLIFALSIVLALIIGFAIGSFVPKLEASIKAKKDAEVLAQQKAEIEEALKQDRLLNRDEFSIKMPIGWAEVQTMPSTTATIMFIKEATQNEELKKIGFKSYYAITYDTLEKRTVYGYSIYLKDTLNKLLPGTKFKTNTAEKINGFEARIIEAEITQKGTDFKVLIAIIKGFEKEDIWTISFNTPVENWDAYKETFYDIARSFKPKDPQLKEPQAETQQEPTNEQN
ncbi:MAG: hypothetical protein PHP74_01800 [Candidatus Gracilibacteria bacterium]|nr:hypothetical protein [Candidatus Gracilibacteria bacterium]